ncbi:MAG: tol-pal system-associated acyl-CoA thioesterase [Xanthomonadales bacterium]|nr:tol-pal system-associated acyl-CoA thioesterase [Xanthomonadales bacterium]
MTEAFVWQLRVYWEDTDAGGVVYHSQYLNFFERARTEWLRSRGIVQSELSQQHNLVFAIRHMDIDFLKPARMDDELEVSVRAVQPGASRLRFEQELKRADDDQVLCKATVSAACLEADRFRPARIPQWLKDAIGAQQQ